MSSAAQPSGAPPPVQSEPSVNVDSKQLAELNEQKDALLSKVATLKKELQDWRTKLDSQVKNYRSEVGDLRKTLNTEVEGLRAEFLELKTALKQQLELTAGLASQEVNDAEARLAQISAQPS